MLLHHYQQQRSQSIQCHDLAKYGTPFVMVGQTRRGWRCAPWLVSILLTTQKETLAAYDTPTGTVILLVGAGLSLLAYRLGIRIGRIPEDKRVLR